MVTLSDKWTAEIIYSILTRPRSQSLCPASSEGAGGGAMGVASQERGMCAHCWVSKVYYFRVCKYVCVTRRSNVASETDGFSTLELFH